MSLERDEFERVYLRLEKPLFNVLYRVLWNTDECRELMQDTFLRVWSKRRSVDLAAVDGLVYTTALNLARNRLRWRKLWGWMGFDETGQGEPPAEADGPDAWATRRADEARVRRALSALPEQARTILLLSEFSGMSTQQMASTLKIAPGTVASRKYRAIEQLRRLLGGSEGMGPEGGGKHA